MVETGWTRVKKQRLEVRSWKLEKKIAKSLCFFLLLISSFSLLSFACPTCTELLTRGRDAFAAWRFGKGIAWSILLLLSIPFLMTATLVFVVWKASRRPLQKETSHE